MIPFRDRKGLTSDHYRSLSDETPFPQKELRRVPDRLGAFRGKEDHSKPPLLART